MDQERRDEDSPKNGARGISRGKRERYQLRLVSHFRDQHKECRDAKCFQAKPPGLFLTADYVN